MESRVHSRFTSLFLILIFFFFALGISLSGYHYYQKQKLQFHQDKQNDLSTIADFKANLLSNWLRERTGDAEMVRENSQIARLVKDWLESPSNSGLEKEILAWMTALRRNYNYYDVLLFDPRRTLRLSVVREGLPDSIHQGWVAKAVESQQSVWSDLHLTPSDQVISLDLFAPLLIPMEGGRQVSGVVGLKIDPYRFLYPLIQSWPTPSPSAETILVRKEGEDVLVLNELRHSQGSALSLRFPMTRGFLPAVMAISGAPGVFETADHRGVQVLTALRSIPGTRWAIAAQLDSEEILLPLRKSAWFYAAATLLLITTAGAGLGLWWRDQRARFYRLQYESEVQRRIAEKRYLNLSQYANDIILFWNQEGRILDANDRALDLYGYSREEFLQLNLWNLQAPETLPEIEFQLKQVEELGGLVFETVHRDKNGHSLQVEISSRSIRQGQETFFQSIVRDIAERKHAEGALIRARDFYLTLLNEFPALIRRSGVDGKCDYINPTWLDFTGRALERELGDGWAEGLHPEDRDRCMKWYLDAYQTRRPFEMEYRLLRFDGEYRWILDHGRPFNDLEGNFAGYIDSCIDISERQRAEEALRHSEKKLADLLSDQKE